MLIVMPSSSLDFCLNILSCAMHQRAFLHYAFFLSGALISNIKSTTLSGCVEVKFEKLSSAVFIEGDAGLR